LTLQRLLERNVLLKHGHRRCPTGEVVLDAADQRGDGAVPRFEPSSSCCSLSSSVDAESGFNDEATKRARFQPLERPATRLDKPPGPGGRPLT